MTLFKELVNLLGNNVEIATNEGTEKLFQAFVEKYPVTRWGRIDWGVLKEKYETASIEGAAEIIDTKLK
ncbi:CDI toxin immunity protein, partial [Paenibacillus glufosinatiresistens]